MSESAETAESTAEGTLIVLVGIPGSGKTTWARTLRLGVEQDDDEDREVEVISSDAIRASIYADVPYDSSQNSATFAVLRAYVVDALIAGKVAVVDATNVYGPGRRELLTLAKALRASAHAVLFDDVRAAVERNAKRAVSGSLLDDGKRKVRVPDEAMIRMLVNYTETHRGMRAEGWDTFEVAGDPHVTLPGGAERYKPRDEKPTATRHAAAPAPANGT